MATITPRPPKIGEYMRGQGTLVAVQDTTPPPPPPKQDYIFQEESARCELRLNNELITRIYEEFSDFYGLGTGVVTAIREMQAWAKKRNIGPNSELEVVVVKVISKIRRQLAERDNVFDNKYRDFETLPIGCKRDLPNDVETVVWSSQQLQ